MYSLTPALESCRWCGRLQRPARRADHDDEQECLHLRRIEAMCALKDVRFDGGAEGCFGDLPSTDLGLKLLSATWPDGCASNAVHSGLL